MHLLLPHGTLRVHFSGFLSVIRAPYRQPRLQRRPGEPLCLPSSSPIFTLTTSGSGSGCRGGRNGKPHGDPISQRHWMGWRLSCQTMQQHSLPSLLDNLQRDTQGIHGRCRLGRGLFPCPFLTLSLLPLTKEICSPKIKCLSPEAWKGKQWNCRSTWTSLQHGPKLCQYLQGPAGLNFPDVHVDCFLAYRQL